MSIEFYKVECITNLHVGSGETNYSVVDNSVEKDAVTQLPVIHASGIKGALRDIVKKQDENLAKRIFGSQGNETETNQGSHKFFDAMLLARPMRVWHSSRMASIPVVTIASVNQFIRMYQLLTGDTSRFTLIDELDFNGNAFLTNAKEDILIEGDSTGKLTPEAEAKLEQIKPIIGETFAVACGYENYDLPVVARNQLENRISKNLWYEEVVPHGSIFYFAVMTPEDVKNELIIPETVQFGGNSSIGCGYTKVGKL